jgi:2-oxoglutarate ferredoxin oxidoreductase subunit gamma
MTKKKDQERYEIRLSGSGGQGLVLAGVMIAEAVGVYEGKNVAQTQSYGPEARGGTSRSDLVISKEEIYYPKTSSLDLLLALTQEAADKYYTHLKDDGILLVDSDTVRQLPPFKRIYSLPFTNTARNEVGTAIVANVISGAALTVISGICKPESFMNAVLNRAPKGTESKNELACKLGFELGRKALKSKGGK